MPLHRAIKDQEIENVSFEVIKTVEYIDSRQLLIYESCVSWMNMTALTPFPRSRMPASIEKFIKASCLSDSINNGYNTKHSVCMFDLY